ncbi:MAG: hypothetical protein QOK29_1097 [Rhodospirillaceae bacterium]|jgi:hypothetical protein|nr:hypothetical protein [Rhodospirillaceae bacterium]
MELDLEFIAVGLMILLVVAIVEELEFRRRQKQRREAPESVTEDPDRPSPPAVGI